MPAYQYIVHVIFIICSYYFLRWFHKKAEMLDLIFYLKISFKVCQSSVIVCQDISSGIYVWKKEVRLCLNVICK